MSDRYNTKNLCDYLEVNRSGYYKWINNKEKKQYQLNREDLIRIVIEIHKEKPSYGYRRIRKRILTSIGWVVSNNYVHNCCKYLNIKSQVKRYKWKKPKEEHILYKNVIQNNWFTTGPLQKIVSDMTNIKYKGKKYELTFYLDTFNNEILSYGLSNKNGDVKPYYKGLTDLLSNLKGQSKTILHTDQGTIYSSRMFTYIHKDYNIIRSMSRAGTPTDNPIIESVNGWIKEEMFIDFDINKYDNLFDFIDMFIKYYNYERPAFALDYKTPIQYKIDLGF